MSSRSVVPHPPAPAALAAFLRGVERRGAVLAELQTGDAAAGDAALAAAMRRFRAEAAAAAMSDWPTRFWRLLLAQPQLRTRTAVALPLDATDRLAELGAGARAALLLRLAAGLDEAAAAAVLGGAGPSYPLALQRALPHHADGRADPQAWQRLREQIHRRIKTLAPERLQRLGHAREAALHGAAAAIPTDPQPAATRTGSRRAVRLALWILLALCAAALAATFWTGSHAWFERGDAGRLRSRLLPEAPPASRYGATAGLIAHRDFAVLADPEAAQADDLAFHSWLAAHDAGSARPGIAPAAGAAMTIVAAAAGPEPATETEADAEGTGETTHAPH